MTVMEPPTMRCRHCENRVVRIQYREGGKSIGGGDLENQWKHQPPWDNPPPCSKNPIMDEDVVDEDELP